MKPFFGLCFILTFWTLGIKSMIYAQIKKDTVLVLKNFNVYFDHNASSINEDQKLKIANYIDSTAKIKNRYFLLEGHTNAIGSIDANLLLSEKRLQSVKDYFKNHKIDSVFITGKAYGKLKPEWDNNTEQGIKNNRQVKIQIVKKFLTKKVIGYVTDSASKVSDVLLLFKNNIFYDSILSDAQGKWEINLPTNMTLQMVAKKQGYLSDVIEITPDNIQGPIALPVIPIRPMATLRITSLNFHSDKCILLPSSIFALQYLTDQILKNPDFCFEIQGHVNAPHIKEKLFLPDYLGLSKSRAGMIYKHFQAAGIESSRMYAEGYSYFKMIYPDAKAEAEHRANRRVEIKILDCSEVSERRLTFKEEDYLRLPTLSKYNKIE